LAADDESVAEGAFDELAPESSTEFGVAASDVGGVYFADSFAKRAALCLIL
jgi:hypothetical protein